MAITVEEIFESPEAEYGANPYAEIRYVIDGTDDFHEAHAAVLTTSPDRWNLYGGSLLFLPRQAVRCRRIGGQLYEGTVTYGNAAVTGEVQKPEFAFDTAGGSQHITQSLATDAYPKQSLPPHPNYPPPDHKGAIGFANGNVEGCDIITPVYRFTETYFKDDAFVTPAYKLLVFSLTGKVNSEFFKGFAPGECLFLGVSGRKRGQGDWSLAYTFAATPNAEGLEIGDITGIAKRGWDYIWVRYAQGTDEDAHSVIPMPQAVYVEQVYVYADLNLLGI
jgi:hypothetical protein